MFMDQKALDDFLAGKKMAKYPKVDPQARELRETSSGLAISGAADDATRSALGL